MNTEAEDRLFHFWGKTSERGIHPVLCHMLDVGLVARELFAAQSEEFKRTFSEVLPYSPSETANLVAFIAALHDIGKISPGFQSKRKDLCNQFDGLAFPRDVEVNHSAVTLAVLPEILCKKLSCSHYCPVEAVCIFATL